MISSYKMLFHSSYDVDYISFVDIIFQKRAYIIFLMLLQYSIMFMLGWFYRNSNVFCLTHSYQNIFCVYRRHLKTTESNLGVTRYAQENDSHWFNIPCYQYIIIITNCLLLTNHSISIIWMKYSSEILDSILALNS